tara:strand:+ start:138 stop:908 length:771 start_codon:yes stop_codon:yes gene_type:complete
MTHVQNLDYGFPLVVIDNFYNEQDMEEIWDELNFLCHPRKMKGPEQTGGAKALESDGSFSEKKSNKGIFLNEAYNNQLISNIVPCTQRLFEDDFALLKNHPSWWFQNINLPDSTVLFSYYENGDFYKAHSDQFVGTMLVWFYKEPRRFEGGDLEFPDYETADGIPKVEVKNNRILIFPSSIKHAVTPISMKEEDMGKKLGRFCMTFGLFPMMPNSSARELANYQKFLSTPQPSSVGISSDSDSEPKLYTPPTITPK